MSVKAVKYGERMLRYVFIFSLFLFILGCINSQTEITSSDSITTNNSSLPPKSVRTINDTSITIEQGIIVNNSQSNTSIKTNISNTNPSTIHNSIIRNPNLVQVYYYYSSTCPFCNAIIPHIDQLAKQYENVTEWHQFNVLVAEDLSEYNAMAFRFNLTLPNERVVPIVVIKGTKLTNMFEINRSLASLLENETRGVS